VKPLTLSLWLLSAVALADVVPPPEPREAEAPSTPAPAPEVPVVTHPAGIERAGAGVIQGGWEYVYAAYGLGTAGVLAYAASLFVRRQRPSRP
jgi:hypothetical protein